MASPTNRVRTDSSGLFCQGSSRKSPETSSNRCQEKCVVALSRVCSLTPFQQHSSPLGSRRCAAVIQNYTRPLAGLPPSNPTFCDATRVWFLGRNL